MTSDTEPGSAAGLPPYDKGRPGEDNAALDEIDAAGRWRAARRDDREPGSAACPFCARIKAHEFDVQWTDAVAFKPLNPVTPGHTLIVSRFHVEDFAQDAETAMLTMKWASYYAYSVGDCNIITSVGAAATQTIRHLHVHVVPRREGDGLALPWTGQEVANVR